jgi:hypothetical protein
MPYLYWPLGTDNEPGGRERVSGEVLAHDEGTYFVMRTDGTVVSQDPRGQLPTRFVNSNLDAFVASLRVLREERAQLSSDPLSNEEEAVQLSRMADRLEALDSAALTDPENWWPCVLFYP